MPGEYQEKGGGEAASDSFGAPLSLPRNSQVLPTFFIFVFLHILCGKEQRGKEEEEEEEQEEEEEEEQEELSMRKGPPLQKKGAKIRE